MTSERKLCYCVYLPDFLSSAPLHLQAVVSDQSAAVDEISGYNMKLQPCEFSAACADTDPDASELEHPSRTLCLCPPPRRSSSPLLGQQAQAGDQLAGYHWDRSRGAESTVRCGIKDLKGPWEAGGPPEAVRYTAPLLHLQ